MIRKRSPNLSMVFFIMWINNNLFYCVYLIIIIFFIFIEM